MDSRAFLGLRNSHNPYRWSLEVTPSLATGGNFLFGGAGIAAAISAMEGTSGRPCVWATAQYLSYAAPGEVMDVDVVLAVEGHQITQSRAVCHVGNREILTVNAAHGQRPMPYDAQWETMPTGVGDPLDYPIRVHHHEQTGTIMQRLEQRLVKGTPFDELDGTPGDGQTIVWARIPDVIDGVDAAALAILGDFVPMAVGQALGIRGGGNSLDNTLRVVRLVPTEWVLLDIRAHGVDHGFGHGLAHMYAQDGTLLATASQSCILRLWKDNEPTAATTKENP